MSSLPSATPLQAQVMNQVAARSPQPAASIHHTYSQTECYLPPLLRLRQEVAMAIPGVEEVPVSSSKPRLVAR